MESFLRAVGLSGEWQALPMTAQSAPLSSRTRSRAQSSDPSLMLSDGGVLPDLACIAAATEKGILALEDEARTLERLPLPEALALVSRWSQSLRRRPRPDEPLASFKAQFLRSNALEKALEGLRRNNRLRNALTDQPLLATARNSGPEEAFKTELKRMLEHCLPRAAAPLAGPVVGAILTEPTEQVVAALTAVRCCKEDWTEVVRTQAARGLERRLDSLAYELQKSVVPRHVGLHDGGTTTPPKSAASIRRASHDRVEVLAYLCEAISESHSRTEARLTEISASLRTLGLNRSSFLDGCKSGATTVVVEEGSVGSVGGTGNAATGEDDLNGGTGGAGSIDLPSFSDCEAAVKMMSSETMHGMRDGLQLLGLPGSPLHFVPGLELRLCGHDIHVAVKTMITHWMNEQRLEFHDVLQRVRRIVEQPPLDEGTDMLSARSIHTVDSSGVATVNENEVELLKLRDTLLQERQALLEQLRSIDVRLDKIDARLTNELELSKDCSSGLNTSRSLAYGVIQFPITSSTPSVPSEFATIVENVAEALAGEMRRTVERLATQLQQRRLQLINNLTSHLENEKGQLSSLVLNLLTNTSGITGPGAAVATSERLSAVLRDARALCSRVEAATAGKTRHKLDEPLVVGTRCRAKWMDGNFYDATIQTVSNDNTVVVNWLRPRPVEGDRSPTRRPLVTVSENGGDDTLNRIVHRTEIRLDETGTDGDQSSAQTAMKLFEARPPEDFACVDCGTAGADWASISFGTYLCRVCALEHQRLGVRLSLVKQLNDGWGWVQQDLEYLSSGGNSSFRRSLETYPAVQTMPIMERYASRFAEYYRRHLDAICTGTQPPQPPQPELATQLSAGEFLSAAEAAAVAQDMAQRFEVAVHVAARGSPWQPMLPGDIVMI